MRHCNHCHVIVEGNNVRCPLCDEKVVGDIPASYKDFYPDYHVIKVKEKRGMLPKVILFLTVLIISVSVLINLLTFPDNLWLIYVVTPTFYVLVLVNHTILSKSHLGRKIILQVAVISTLLFFIDYSLGFARWSVNFVHPFLILSATLLITVIILLQRLRWRDFIGYIITMILLGFTPLILYVTGVSTLLWPSAGTALYALLTLIGLFLFSDQSFKHDITRRFHF